MQCWYSYPMFFLLQVDCTHRQHLCLYVNKLYKQRSHISRPFTPNLPYLIYPLNPQHPTSPPSPPSSLDMTFDLAQMTKARFALYSYFLIQKCVFLFMTTKETSQSCWSAQTLDANLSEVPLPQPQTHTHLFLILWITKSVSFHMILPDLLLDHVSMCVCLPCVFVWEELQNWEC